MHFKAIASSALFAASVGLAGGLAFTTPASAGDSETCAGLDPALGGMAENSDNLDVQGVQAGDTIAVTGAAGTQVYFVPPGTSLHSTAAEQAFGLANAVTTPANFTATSAGTFTVRGFAASEDFADATFARASVSVTCHVGGLGPTAVEQIGSQSSAGSSVMSQGASQNISTGIGNAIAERFFGGGGTSFSGAGSSASGYVSTAGFQTFVRNQRNARFAPSDSPILTGLDAIDAALVNGSSANIGVDGVSPYVLGADPVRGAAPIAPVMATTNPTTLNAWVRGSFTHYDGDAFSGNTWNGVAGLDYLVRDGLLVGVLAGYENGDFDFDTTNGAFEGSGFTAGAYVGMQLSDTIVADAFVTHSWLTYDTRSGTATGTTDATRWLVSLNLTGQYALAERLVLEPNAQFFYAHENRDAYTLSDATVVAENSVDSGRLSVGPRLRYSVSDNWTAVASLQGEYDFSSETQTNTTLPDFDGMVSARFGLGMDGTFANGWSLNLSGDVGGIGSGDFLSYTGTGKLRIPLN